MNREKILVTSALPYANGPIHFGHIAGAYLPADIFVRHKRMTGADVVYICGTDEHGVAITISAQQAGVTPQALVAKYHDVIKSIFDRMDIRFDNFSGTARPVHHAISQQFFTDIERAGYIEARVSKQLYCEQDQLFLADRYIVGTCPYCGFAGARGDECGGCGKWLDPREIIDPHCKLCGNAPVERETKNWYLLLDKLQPKLEAWLAGKAHWKENVMNFVQGWISKGLEARAITRDMSWGIPVPLPGTEGKVLYVWFDAPIGYISSTVEWAEGRGEPDLWKKYWCSPDTRLVHFIGKDNIPFHCIVFPAMCMARNEVAADAIVLPENVPANEFYNLEGRQFSKSEGWYIDIDDFFTRYSTDAIRYAICANMPEKKDSEFTWNDFLLRNNSELADIFGNLANRVFKFLERSFGSKIPACVNPDADDEALLARMAALPKSIAAFIDTFEFRKALYEWIDLAREANKYFDKKTPWKTVKTDMAVCGTTMHVCLRVLRSLAVCGYPFMPTTAQKLWSILGCEGEVAQQGWFASAGESLSPGTPLGAVEILFTKIEPSQIEAEIARLKQWAADAAKGDKKMEEEKPREYAPLKPTVTYDDFAKLDFRVARILEAEAVPKSKKLVKMQIDLGFEKRQIVAGILEYFAPDALVGRTIIVVANLAPAKLMGIESNGMLLASKDGNTLTLLTADIGPGSVVS